MKVIRLLFFALSSFLIFGNCADSRPVNHASTVAISAEDIQYHINYLASDELEGRKSGTSGCDAAAEYIASEFNRYGIEPFGDSGTYFQKFDLVGGIKLGRKNELQLSRGAADSSLTVGIDFMPTGFSASQSVSGKIIFAGYGIVAERLHYNDYDSINVADKIVMILTGSPAAENPHSSFAEYEPLRYKALQARKHGATALMIVNNRDGEERLAQMKYDRVSSDAGLPVIHIKRAIVNWLLEETGTTINSLQATIDSLEQSRTFDIPQATAQITADVRRIRYEAANVIGLLPGRDETLKNEHIVIGAHYDHLGRTPEGSLDPDIEDGIRNGADDNASGTAGVLELAQYFSLPENTPDRSLLFVTFAGEELGLLGSAHYVEQPQMLLDETMAMINMDMVGRLQDSTLIVHGVGTSPEWPILLNRLNDKHSFNLKLKQDGRGPSDHSSFYNKNVPVLFFFTGLHDDYHRVSDDSEKVNAKGESNILHLVADVIKDLAAMDTTIAFTKAETERPAMRGFRVSVGTIPDYAAEVEGVKLSGVRENGPAARAGMQAGDIIIKFADYEIKNIYDYTYALGEFSPGNTVDVVIIRDGQEKILYVQLASSQR